MSYQAGLPLQEAISEAPRQVLPGQGSCQYFGPVFSPRKALEFYQFLLTQTAWRQDEVFLYGKHYVTARKVAWFGDSDLSYTYSGSTHDKPLPWHPALLEIRQQVEALTRISFNACLANLYKDGSQGMGWHQDNEKELDVSAIASVSLGAERRFDFRHVQSREKVSVFLEQGSLLLMTGDTQKYWQHQLPKSAKVTTPRINLTFRRVASPC